MTTTPPSIRDRMLRAREFWIDSLTYEVYLQKHSNEDYHVIEISALKERDELIAELADACEWVSELLLEPHNTGNASEARQWAERHAEKAREKMKEWADGHS